MNAAWSSSVSKMVANASIHIILAQHQPILYIVSKRATLLVSGATTVCTIRYSDPVLTQAPVTASPSLTQ